MTAPTRAYPATILALLFAVTLLGPAGGDPTAGTEGPQYRTATWSFDTPGDYARSGVLVSGGNATLLGAPNGFAWTDAPHFLANGSADPNVQVEPGRLRLAGYPNNLVANGDFSTAAA
ncbi:MAG: hypothetical protein AABY30_00285, partial [Candidatus Thermoplasmatota archaeon]